MNTASPPTPTPTASSTGSGTGTPGGATGCGSVTAIVIPDNG